MNITLNPDTQNLDEVIIVAYGTADKGNFVGSAISLKGDQIANRPINNVVNAIEGQSPGVITTSANGQPGSTPNVRIRGIGSVNSSSSPLYVVDGLITSASQFRNLNPADIDTFTILKDAQATSIYGNRAASGVVVITTKGGKYNSALKISYDALTSFSTYPKTDYNMSNGKQLLTIQNQYGGGFGSTLTQQQIDNWTTDTDWSKQFMRTGISQQHNLGLSLGGESINNYTSLGYAESEGIIKSTDFKRFTLRNNLNGKSKNGKLNYGTIIGLGYSRRNQLDDETNTAINANVIQNPLFGSILSPTYVTPSPYTNGRDLFNAIGSDSAGNRPWILQDNINGGIRNQFTEISIAANANVSYKITDYLIIINCYIINNNE